MRMPSEVKYILGNPTWEMDNLKPGCALMGAPRILILLDREEIHQWSVITMSFHAKDGDAKNNGQRNH